MSARQAVSSASEPAKKKSKLERIERAATPRNGKADLRIVSLNVAGLRAVLKDKQVALKSLVDAEQPDILCLNEHKLKAEDVPEAEEQLAELLPEFAFRKFACSTARKGYSGVAVLAKEALDVEEGCPGLEDPVANEGRVLTVKLASFNVVAVYVPNSGQDLKRLDYRVDTWDPTFAAYLKTLAPVVVLGDLNVAHGARDIHNMYARPNFDDLCTTVAIEDQYVGLKALLKQAGLTPRERNSFGSTTLADLVDTFRHFHPTASGVFTYFSQRAVQNRPNNKGLRLDYVLASPSLLDANGVTLTDSFVLDDAPKIADHCAVGCDLRLPPSENS